MAISTRISRRRIVLLGLVLGLLASVAVAAPALAATTTRFQASFVEQTSFVPCPPGPPPKAQCFSGHGDGEAIPPGGPATESFQGFVDVAAADPVTHCTPNYTAATIATGSGKLYLVAQGRNCPTGPTSAVDNGTWTAVGGTGIFADARGSGTFSTEATFNPDGTISSKTTYDGTLRLSN
ncbi:MAG TPA: hypothetical protein VG370_32065 [Chloroflexota bacterium]|jgi:hypothetical protein|nr:hypothetical protein [Chloroflexota bacterium]